MDYGLVRAGDVLIVWQAGSPVEESPCQVFIMPANLQKDLAHNAGIYPRDDLGIWKIVPGPIHNHFGDILNEFWI